MRHRAAQRSLCDRENKTMIETIYSGWPGMRIGAELGIEMDPTNRYFGWLFAKHPDGQWVTVADLKPNAARICANRA
jgi:hypothetical protein